GVGEVTLKKEIVTSKYQHKTKIESPDTQSLLDEATQRGLPIILHNDRGVPGDKNKYTKLMVAAFHEFADRVNNSRDADDTLKTRPGVNPADVPRRKPKIVWAHGAGISRFTAE